MKSILFVFLLAAVTFYSQNDISNIFEDRYACFVLYDFKNGNYIRYNEERCEQRFLPASTFKIPNSLIVLEKEIIPDENYTIKWDSIDRGWDKWNMDQNLKTGFKYSAVWFYKVLARQIDRETYQNYLNEFDYGNKQIGEQIDYFWLDWSLQISANEQVEFLKKLVENELPLSQRSIDITKEIMIVEETEDYVLRAKTGLGDKRKGVYTGWYVGYVETDDNTYIFAMNMEEEVYEDIKSQVRIELTKSVLKELGIIN